ncbi:glycosyltransferase family 2 protein [Segetibacter koreensis]|uniref:glycosyltransferase family 2 protein n=1 Tax=Segetibacter koreensis TaxID=398037 RepID=UPI0003662E86|nr:glycosyltransferase [Segetibacter koreensis]
MHAVPLVSIICITYNHEKYISLAIEGFLMQKTSFPFEILIHDDCSTDSTASIIKSYADKYPDLIRPIYQTVNQFSLGKKIAPIVFPYCRGKYLALCEGDDYWIDPNKLQKQVDFLEGHPDYVMCFTNGCIVDSSGVVIQEKQLRGETKDTYTFEDAPFQAPTHTRVFRKFDYKTLPESFKKARGLDTYLAVWQSQFGKVKFLDYVSSTYRHHSGGIFSSLSNTEKIIHITQTRYVLLELFPGHDNIQKELVKVLNGGGDHIKSLNDFSFYTKTYFEILKKVQIKYSFLLTAHFVSGLFKCCLFVVTGNLPSKGLRRVRR